MAMTIITIHHIIDDIRRLSYSHYSYVYCVCGTALSDGALAEVYFVFRFVNFRTE